MGQGVGGEADGAGVDPHEYRERRAGAPAAGCAAAAENSLREQPAGNQCRGGGVYNTMRQPQPWSHVAVADRGRASPNIDACIKKEE
jgi:hypothetical protein